MSRGKGKITWPLAWPLISEETVGKSLKVLKPQFSWCSWSSKSQLTEVWGLSERQYT